MAIVDQRRAIARDDQFAKQREVAAVAEYARRVAAKHQIAQIVGAETRLDQILPAFEIAQHRRSETRAARRHHMGPQRLGIAIIFDPKFGQREQSRSDRGRILNERGVARFIEDDVLLEIGADPVHCDPRVLFDGRAEARCAMRS